MTIVTIKKLETRAQRIAYACINVKYPTSLICDKRCGFKSRRPEFFGFIPHLDTSNGFLTVGGEGYGVDRTVQNRISRIRRLAVQSARQMIPGIRNCCTSTAFTSSNARCTS